MSAPKCTSWFGHSFEPRYSLGAKVSGGKIDYEGNAYYILELEKLKQPKTYIHDICVRCGHVIHAPKSPNGVGGRA